MKKNTIKVSTLEKREVYAGEPIERLMERAISNGEKIGSEVGQIFTERKEGVGSGYNIRTDRFEVALDGIDKIQKSQSAKRAEMTIVKEEKDGEPESTQDTKN